MILRILVIASQAGNFHFKELITECSEANISKIEEDKGRNYQHFGVKYYDGTRDTISMDTNTHYFELLDSRGNAVAGSILNDMEPTLKTQPPTDGEQLSSKNYNYTEGDLVNFSEYLFKERGYEKYDVYHAELENWKGTR